MVRMEDFIVFYHTSHALWYIKRGTWDILIISLLNQLTVSKKCTDKWQRKKRSTLLSQSGASRGVSILRPFSYHRSQCSHRPRAHMWKYNNLRIDTSTRLLGLQKFKIFSTRSIKSSFFHRTSTQHVETSLKWNFHKVMINSTLRHGSPDYLWFAKETNETIESPPCLYQSESSAHGSMHLQEKRRGNFSCVFQSESSDDRRCDWVRMVRLIVMFHNRYCMFHHC